MGTSEEKTPFKPSKPASSAQVGPFSYSSFRPLSFCLDTQNHYMDAETIRFEQIFNKSSVCLMYMPLVCRTFLPHRIQTGLIQCRFVWNAQLWPISYLSLVSSLSRNTEIAERNSTFHFFRLIMVGEVLQILFSHPQLDLLVLTHICGVLK